MKVLMLAFALFGTVHDFFVSILTIRHVRSTRTLDLTWRITAHDIEHALENVAPLKLASAQEHPKADSILVAYLNEHLHLTLDEQPVTWAWIGRELDGETLYCYLQVNDVDPLGTLTVKNTLLQDLFYEQQNLVHLEREHRPVRSHTFVQGSGPYTFTW